MNKGFPTPIALIIFNRPNETELVFSEIRKVRPQKLFLIADGARSDHSDDIEFVNRTREIASNVDWDCDLFTNFSEKNLGCKTRVVSGLDWLFEHVEEAIILEDDCVPSSEFFHFCSMMLEKFRPELTVGSISGSNPLVRIDPEKLPKADFFYSRYPQIWGWATWKRAWENYDSEICSLPGLTSEPFFRVNSITKSSQRFWSRLAKLVHLGKLDTWDVQLNFSFWKSGMFSVIPTRNLVSNIGFGGNATHTWDSRNVLANIPTEHWRGNCDGPEPIEPDETLDEITRSHQFELSSTKKLVLDLYDLLSIPTKKRLWSLLKKNPRLS